jgi:uncharacterized protein (UPF0332 family)
MLIGKVLRYERTESEKELLNKAKQSLNAARLLFNDDFADFSASRAYYAMFYSIEAGLLRRNLSFSKHSATLAAFGKEFIRTGIFPAKYHQYVLEAFNLRNAGDYGAMNSVSKIKRRNYPVHTIRLQ